MTAEYRIIELLCLNPPSRRDIIDTLTTEDFTDPGAAKLFDQCRKHIAAREAFEVRVMQSITGQQWDRTTPDETVALIINAADRRRILAEVEILAMMAADPGEPVEALRNRFDELLGCQWDSRNAIDTPLTRDELGDETAAAIDIAAQTQTPWYPWGIDALDCVPLSPGNLVTLAARPSVGKTAMALSCIRQQSAAGIRAGLICLEMSDVELCVRYMAQESGMTFAEIRRGVYDQGQHQLYQQAQQAFRASRCEIYAPQRRMTPRQIERVIARWKKRCGIDVVYVDYLQLLEHPKADNLRIAVGESIQDLKDIGGRHDIPIVILSQLNRDAQDSRPTMAQLKETGSIEEHSDAVVLIDRHNDPNSPCKRTYSEYDPAMAMTTSVDISDGRTAALIIAKNRNGPTGTRIVKYEPETMEFTQ